MMFKQILTLLLTACVALLAACGDSAPSQKELTVDNLVGYWQFPSLPNGYWVNGSGDVYWLQASGRYERSIGDSLHIYPGKWRIVGQAIEITPDQDLNGSKLMPIESFTGDEMLVSGPLVWDKKSVKVKRYASCPPAATPNVMHLVEYTDPTDNINISFAYDGLLSGDIDSDGELHAVLTTSGDNGENSRYVTSRPDGCGLAKYKVPPLSYSAMAIDGGNRIHLAYAGLPENATGGKTAALSYATRSAKDVQSPWEVTRLVTNTAVVPQVDVAVTPQGDVVIAATGDGQALTAWRKPAGSEQWSKSVVRDKLDGAFSLALDSKGKAHIATAEWGEPGSPAKLTVYSEGDSAWQSQVLDTAGTQRDFQGRVPEVDLAIGPGDEWAVISGAKGNSVQVKDGSVALGRGKPGALQWSIIGSGGRARVVYDSLGRLHATWLIAIPYAQFLPQRKFIHAVYDGKQEQRYLVGGALGGDPNDDAPYRMPLLAAGPAGQVAMGTFTSVFIMPAPGKSPTIVPMPTVQTTLTIQPGSGGVDPDVTVRIPELGVACSKTCTIDAPVGRMVEVTFDGSKAWQPTLERDHAGRFWLHIVPGNVITQRHIGPGLTMAFNWAPIAKAETVTAPNEGWDSAAAQLPAQMETLTVPVTRQVGGPPETRLLRWDANDKALPALDITGWKPLAFSPISGGGWWASGVVYGGSTLGGQKFASNGYALARIDANGATTLAIPLPPSAGVTSAHCAYDGGVAWWDGNQIQRWDNEGKPLTPLAVSGIPSAHPTGGLLVRQRGDKASTVWRVDAAGQVSQLLQIPGQAASMDVRTDGSFVVAAWLAKGASFGGSTTETAGYAAIDCDAAGQVRWVSKSMPGTTSDRCFVVANGPQAATMATGSVSVGDLFIGYATANNIQKTEAIGGAGTFTSTGGQVFLQGLVRHGKGVTVIARVAGSVNLYAAKLEGNAMARIDLVGP